MQIQTLEGMGNLFRFLKLLVDYFIAHSKRSGNTPCQKLNHPRMDLKSLKCELAAVPCRFDNTFLFDEYKLRFDYWLFVMSKGFNVLLYGIGSKRSLLEEFRVKVLAVPGQWIFPWVKYEANLEPVDFRSVTAFWNFHH